MTQGKDDLNLPMSAAFEYMEYAGYACLAWCWARMAVKAADKIAEGATDVAFLQAKIDTAKFYMERIAPRTLSLKESMLASPESLMALDEEQLFMP